VTASASLIAALLVARWRARFPSTFCSRNFSGGKTDNHVWGTRATHINRTRKLLIKKPGEHRLSIRPC
jgi:hypothetical protein